MNYNLGYNNQSQNPVSMQNNFQGFQQSSQFFLQPQGSAFMINSLNEINSVPAGMGITVAICLRENTLFLKTLQNGIPVTLGYRLSSINEEENNQKQETSNTNQNKELMSTMENYEQRLKKLEDALNIKQKGGTSQWQL